ncbi:hypothetical protein FNU79_08590 [Deinococcus detaillensis]|uniref:Uncharacterized protein n=1 Tax=Deinococcus detaillensis TaxID=2592048 RepID=A0A553V037_9DEIO|nr:hypothetical protein [Deinococcus detaillensis]TSA85836.1 hypothetical protein FNU79_08590 [Deinococcus detaillensis]
MKKFSLVSVLSLTAMLSSVSVGGALTVKTLIPNAPLNGCAGQSLANGVWSFKVTGQQAGVGNREGFWLVNFEATNLTKQVQDSVNIIDESRVSVTDGAGKLVKDGAIVAIGGNADQLRLAPGATGSFTLMSRVNDAQTPWSKVFVPMKSGNPNLMFVASPDLTFDLTCP